MNVGANLWFGGHLFNSAKSQIEDEEKGLEMKNSCKKLALKDSNRPVRQQRQ